jgi:hypothetical protein
LPDSYPGIEFDANGVCNVCLSAERDGSHYEKRGKAELDGIIRSAKQKTSKYDVIVPLSGGKDSTYVAYYLKKNYDVKILGANYDIGYRSEYALQNLDILSDRLDIDLVTIRPRKSFLQKLFVHFFRQKGEFCSVCNNIGYLIMASFSYQQKKLRGHAPLMVGGWSKQYEFQQGVSVASMQYFFDTLSPELFDELKRQPFIEEKVVASYRKIHDPRQAVLGSEEQKKMGRQALNAIQLPDFIEWNIRQIPKILTEKLGWRHPRDVHESHFDCVLFPIKEYLKHKKYGLTQETIKNSRLIREGLMSREEALKRLGKEQTRQPAVFESFLEELGLTQADINWHGEWSK